MVNLRTKKTGPPKAERFALCVTPGPQRSLIALCAVNGVGIVSVRRAAVRGNDADGDAYDRVRTAAQMWRTARSEAPCEVVVAAHPGPDGGQLAERLRRACGPFSVVSVMEVDGRHEPGRWGTAVCAASATLGMVLDMEADWDAVRWLAKDAESRATGTS